MTLKPQDILFLLKLVSQEKSPWSFNRLAVELTMSPAEVHAASKRVLAAKLAIKIDDTTYPVIRNLQEFLLYGLQYVFVAERGPLTRGMPTSYAAEPLASHFIDNGEPPPVWPDPDGDTRGESFSPLYSAVPKAAKVDQGLYELLVLIDAIRGGRAREREIARQELTERLKHYEKTAKP